MEVWSRIKLIILMVLLTLMISVTISYGGTSLFFTVEGHNGEILKGGHKIEEHPFDMFFIESLRGLDSGYRNYLNFILKNHTYIISDDSSVIKIGDGIRFWSDFMQYASFNLLGFKDAKSKIFHRHLIKYFPEAESITSFIIKLLGDVDQTLILDDNIILKNISISKLDLILNFLEMNGVLYSKHGNFLVLGKGHSFFLFNDLLYKAQNLTSSSFIKDFQRALRFISFNNIPLIVSPDLTGSSFNISESINIKQFISDITQMRLYKFSKRVNSWQRTFLNGTFSRGVYSLKGPVGDYWDGGYLRALYQYEKVKQLNPLDDHQQLIEKVENKLSEQFGNRGTIKTFESLWGDELSRGVSVPFLLRDGIRRTKKTYNSNLLELDDSAIAAIPRTTRLDMYSVAKGELEVIDEWEKRIIEKLNIIINKLKKSGIEDIFEDSKGEDVFLTERKSLLLLDVVEYLNYSDRHKSITFLKDHARAIVDEMIWVGSSDSITTSERLEIGRMFVIAVSDEILGGLVDSVLSEKLLSSSISFKYLIESIVDNFGPKTFPLTTIMISNVIDRSFN